ncbi:hypothetical protein Bca101_087288 [Brassica carinata]
MWYWVLGLVPSPGKALPGEVDRCLTGPRGMTHHYSLTSKYTPRSVHRKCTPEVYTGGVHASDAYRSVHWCTQERDNVRPPRRPQLSSPCLISKAQQQQWPSFS